MPPNAGHGARRRRRRRLVGHVGLEPGGAVAELVREGHQPLGLQAHERDAGALGGGRRAVSAPMPRAAPVIMRPCCRVSASCGHPTPGTGPYQGSSACVQRVAAAAGGRAASRRGARAALLAGEPVRPPARLHQLADLLALGKASAPATQLSSRGEAARPGDLLGLRERAAAALAAQGGRVGGGVSREEIHLSTHPSRFGDRPGLQPDRRPVAARRPRRDDPVVRRPTARSGALAEGAARPRWRRLVQGSGRARSSTESGWAAIIGPSPDGSAMPSSTHA